MRVRSIPDVIEKGRDLAAEIERSYASAQKHYDDPPAWIIALPVVYNRVIHPLNRENPLLAAVSGWLKYKLPSLGECSIDAAEQSAKEQVLHNVEILTGLLEDPTCPLPDNSPRQD